MPAKQKAHTDTQRTAIISILRYKLIIMIVIIIIMYYWSSSYCPFIVGYELPNTLTLTHTDSVVCVFPSFLTPAVYHFAARTTGIVSLCL